jgi:hypothetical protein
MGALSILKLLLSITATLAEYVKNRQLMDAGAAEVILKGVADANEAVSRANAARAGKLPDVNTDPQNRDNQITSGSDSSSTEKG